MGGTTRPSNGLRRWIGVWLVIASAATSTACGDVNAALGDLVQARAAAADLHTAFVKAANASDRAVMADTDDLSVASSKDAAQAKQAIQKDIETLAPLLQRRNYAAEAKLLQEFTARLAEYGKLDTQILDLAVDNTNLKAQRLSFGPGADAAKGFSAALAHLEAASPADRWRVTALAASAVASLREIQVLQAPHIADPDDAAMTSLEQQMAASDTDVRAALAALAPLVARSSQPQVAAARTALDQFKSINDQILALSRRNTNVRALALSLNQKRPLTAACEESLRALEDALSKHGYPEGR